MNNINLNTKIKEPKYVTIYNKLFKIITEGNYSHEDRLPSEPDLAKELGVSRTTLRQALSLLEDDGLIKIIRGKGNFITHKKPDTNYNLEKISHPLYKFLNESDKIDKVEMEFHLETCSDFFHSILGIKPAALAVIDRWYKIQDETIAYAFTIVPIENISTYNVDLNNENELLKFVENDIYDICSNAELQIKFSSSGNFASKKAPFSEKEEFYLLEEKLCQNKEFPISFTKYYLPLDMSTIKFSIKK